MAFTVGRIAFDSPEQWTEQLGDPVTNIGGAPVPAIRTALRHSVDVPTFTTPIGEDTLERRLRLRRQIRSLLNNTSYKMTGIYLVWDDDPEQNGWYIPDQGQMAAGADSPLTHGYFKLENFVWFKLGAMRTHRPAAGLSIKDLRTGLWARDILKRVYSTDFSTLQALPLTYLRAGATDIVNSISLNTVATVTQPAGRDGGASIVAPEQTDLGVISYELLAASRNLGDVVLYDQRGKAGLPAAAEDPQIFGWEEIYGPDYAFTAGSVPVLDNGFIRVIFDEAHTPGFKVFTWSGSEYIEQGKMICNIWGPGVFTVLFRSMAVMEYTPERAVVQVILALGELRLVVFITLQRGWRGPRFELYPSYVSTDVPLLMWCFSTLGENTSVAKIDSGSAGKIVATAGSGSTSFSEQILGASTFTGENEILSLIQGSTGSMAMMMAVLQANIAVWAEANNHAYGGSAKNAIALRAPEEDHYVSAHMCFAEQHNDQLLEAESMTLGTGTTIITDAGASNGKATSTTRTSDLNAHVTRAAWPNGDSGTYRIFAHVHTGAGFLAKIYAKTPSTKGPTVIVSASTYVWVDLGEVVTTNEILEIHLWNSEATTSVLDRIEAFLVTDRNPNSGFYSGGRDLGESILYDSRVTPTVVTRT